jgi:hypothetical protein
MGPARRDVVFGQPVANRRGAASEEFGHVANREATRHDLGQQLALDPPACGMPWGVA